MHSPPAINSSPIEFNFPQEPSVEYLIQEPNHNIQDSPIIPSEDVESIKS